VTVRTHLGSIPTDLARALDETYRDVVDHFLREEWDDAQVDAGRFSEAALRYLEWKLDGSYTPIDGKHKPNRSKVTSAARNATRLDATLRSQVPQAVELIMDFRNNRNSAHLGSIDANKMDATCVLQNATWVVGEIARIESIRPIGEIQELLDQLAERHIPLIQTVGGVPIVLDPKLSAGDRALVLLYQQGAPVDLSTLRNWAEYTHATRWRENVIGALRKQKLVHLSPDGLVHLLRPGETEAQRILLEAGSAAA